VKSRREIYQSREPAIEIKAASDAAKTLREKFMKLDGIKARKKQ